MRTRARASIRSFVRLRLDDRSMKWLRWNGKKERRQISRAILLPRFQFVIIVLMYIRAQRLLPVMKQVVYVLLKRVFVVGVICLNICFLSMIIICIDVRVHQPATFIWSIMHAHTWDGHMRMRSNELCARAHLLVHSSRKCINSIYVNSNHLQNKKTTQKPVSIQIVSDFMSEIEGITKIAATTHNWNSNPMPRDQPKEKATPRPRQPNHIEHFQ